MTASIKRALTTARIDALEEQVAALSVALMEAASSLAKANARLDVAAKLLRPQFESYQRRAELRAKTQAAQQAQH